MRKRIVTWGVCVLAGAAGAVAAGRDSAWAAPGSFALVPSSPAHVATRRAHFSYVAVPGQSIVDSVQLFNMSPVPQQFELYASDAYDTSTGTFALRLPSASQKGVGSWTTLSLPATTVPAHVAVSVAFSVHVPSWAPPGDYAGGIVALDVTPSPVEPRSTSVSLRQGIGTAVFLHVSGAMHPAAAITALRTTTSVGPLAPAFGSSAASVAVSIRNVGNTLLQGSLEAQITDVFGNVVKRYPAQTLAAVVPGSTVTVREPRWTGLPPNGPDHVVVRFTAAGIRPIVRASTVWVVPWGLLAVLAGSVIGWGALLTRLVARFVRARRR